MLGELTATRGSQDWVRVAARWHVRAQYAVALSALAGVGLLCAIILSRSFFLGSDSANDYAHVGYISGQLFHHGRLPLHVSTLESGRALAFPYGVLPWVLTSIPYVLLGDWSVTASMIAGFALYGYAATCARPALRDPRLLSLIYVNTFLIEGLVSFQMAFIWACGLFFLFIAAADQGRWPLAGLLGVATITTHPFAGVAAVAGYTAYTCVRRPREILALGVMTLIMAAAVAPFAVYIHSAPAVASTHSADLLATLRWIARYRGLVIVLPLVVSAFAPAFRVWFLPVFAVMALTFIHRIEHRQVNTYGLTSISRPFYGQFLASPAFDRSLRYRVLEPNDREDGAAQLMRGGAVLTQEFFDQSQFRRWWNSPAQYACFLGAKHVDVVLLERDYPMKFSQNEDVRLDEFVRAGTATVIYYDQHPDRKGMRFWAYDVRRARTDGARLDDCGL